ncbi:MAG: SusC/RagA family TonB-linked outer membrane protein [Dysgonamonadaceae bacterium]|jgi:TonB-linked SusC/RagA family outer membrane protein|nr:SusC/RagA family TonB-linked outer membrane protein [Dysgonamonadaceae bacterium]
MKNKTKYFLVWLLCLGAGASYASDNLGHVGNSPTKEFSEQQQGRTAQGIVVDETGEPVIGATIVVKGLTGFGSVTDVDGKFNLANIPASAKELVISYIGMETQTVSIRTDLMRITLKSDTKLLEEVVVTGMTKMDKRLFTGASSSLKSDDVKLDGVADISRSLEGRVAGVSVQNVSGTFGTAPKIKVRGATSLYGDSKPLWVVDGVIVENVADVSSDALSSGDAETLISNAIAGLNASDIESFDILKDGSATSIYGAKAMAGVIVVTTKKGREGQSKISYTGEFTTRLIPSYSTFNIMNSQDQMGFYRELEDKGWLNFTNTYRDRTSGVYGKMYELMNTYDEATGGFLLPNTEKAKNAYLRAAEMRNTDWFKELFSMALQQNHSVGISGGSEKTQYYSSLSMMIDPGWYESSQVNRYTAMTKIDHHLSRKLSASVKSSLSYRKQRAPGTLSQDVSALYGEVSRSFDINPYSYALNTSRTLDPNEYYTRDYAAFNIHNELENNYMDYNVVDLLIQGELQYKPIKELSFSALGSMTYSTSSIEHNIKDNSNTALAYRAMGEQHVLDNNTYLWDDPDNPYDIPISVLPDGGIYDRTDRKATGYVFRLTGDYNKVFLEDHIVKLYAGMEMTSAEKDRSWFRGWGRQYSMGDVSKYAWEAFRKGFDEGYDYFTYWTGRERTAAFFGLLNYSYKGKYNVNLTARDEGSNMMGKSRSSRWLPTWNVGLAWSAHEEDWFDKQKILTHAKTRASYSLTGSKGGVSNADIIFRSAEKWRPNGTDREMYNYISSLANTELTYEKKHELNLGIDLGFLKNRVNFTGDIYWRNNYDLVGPIFTSGIGGFVDKRANAAAMKANGVDLQLSVTNIKNKDLTWTTDYIFSHNKTEITKLETGRSVSQLVRGVSAPMVGYPSRALFSIPFAGLNEEGIPMFYNADGEISQFVDFQETINTDFLKYEGSMDPTLYGSLGNVVRYKNFRLNVFITYSFGNKVRLYPKFSRYYTDLTATPREFNNRWMMPGDETITNIPVVLSYRQVYNTSTTDAYKYVRYAYSAYNYSTVRVADGGFVRVKEISLSYNVPKDFVKNIGLNSLSLKLQGTNPFLLYADKRLNGQDPEFVQSGGVSSPFAKQVTATLSLGL